MTMIDTGGQLPGFELKVGESGSVSLPQDIETDYAVILFYRGHW